MITIIVVVNKIRIKILKSLVDLNKVELDCNLGMQIIKKKIINHVVDSFLFFNMYKTTNYKLF